LELLDERRRLVPGELAPGLSLGEAHRTTGVSKIGVAGVVEERGQLLELPERRWWARLLAERHASSLAYQEG
jgi:hypothetical protein